jgi:HK97 family phage major capsid protein
MKMTDSTQELFRAFNELRSAVPDAKALKNEMNKKTFEMSQRLETVEQQMAMAYPHIMGLRDARNMAAVAATRSGDLSASIGGGTGEVRAALAQFARTGEEIKNTISTAEPDEGGYTVVPVLADQIRSKVHDVSAMARIARQETLSRGNTWSQPVNTDLSSASWVGEKAARPAGTAPTFERADIALNELASNIPITQRALDDSFYDLGGFLQRNMGEQFARSIGAALLTGNGVEKPKGLLDYPTAATADGTRAWFTLQHINTGAAGAFGTSPTDNLIDLAYSIRAPYRQNARWLMTRATAAVIRKVKDTDGRSLWVEPLTEGMAPVLLGHPVELDEAMPEIGAGAKAIAFGDFAECYSVVTRPGLRLLRDPYTVKGSVLFYAYTRIGGGVVNSEAVKFLRFAAS